jgi:tryptophanyl-tRNA synthetase
MKRVMTGVKPTNRLHLGNYFGIIPTIKQLQQYNHEILLFSANLHTLTTESNLKNESELIIKFFLSCLDCSNITLYIQSEFPQLTYCMWLFSCCTPMGFLDKMTQYKDKLQKNKQSINSGLFNYPLLMAADILMTDANLIPVGQDQVQHLELTRDIAKFFENKFHTSFTIPEPILSHAPKIYDLQNFTKMSKSNLDEKGTIFLDDSNETIAMKIKKAVTDNELMPENIENIKNTRKFVWNLCQIFTLVTGKSYEFVESEFANQRISYFKSQLTQVIIDFITPIRYNMQNITSDQVKSCLNHEKMHKIFDKKIHEIKSKIF